MIVKILGTLDILSAAIFWIFSVFHIVSSPVIILVAFYLLAKGMGFVIAFQDRASILDIIAGLIIFLAASFSLPFFVVVIVSLYLLQKGIFSLL